jgi:hypothetical protein
MKNLSRHIFLCSAFLSTAVLGMAETIPVRPNHVRGQFLELNDNGAWSWFMDECVIVDKGGSQ